MKSNAPKKHHFIGALSCYLQPGMRYLQPGMPVPLLWTSSMRSR